MAVTLDLYFKVISLRNITDHLHQFYDMSVDHSTVYQWIVKYTDIIKTYVQTVEPDIGNIWHSDEMKGKMGSVWQWVWNMMDKKTRFQLATMVTNTREIQDAKSLFKQSTTVATKKPKIVVTDGLQSYPRVFG